MKYEFYMAYVILQKPRIQSKLKILECMKFVYFLFQHDYPSNCLFDRSGGTFLMHPNVVKGVTESYRDFSSCSLSNISLTLGSLTADASSESNCFIRGKTKNNPF